MSLNPIPAGSEMLVNTYTTNYQTKASITGLIGGGFVVTWQSSLQDGDDSGIFAQRYDAAGTSIGAEFQVNSQTIDYQSNPSITNLSGGGFVVTWQSNGQDGDDYGIFGQRYDATGVTVGIEFQVNTNKSGSQSEPSVIGLSDGGFVVTWHSEDQDGDEYGIFAQRFYAAGSVAEVEFQVNTYTTSYQLDPSITALSDGGFVITWRSADQDGSQTGVFAQRYNSDNNAVGAEFQVNTYTTSLQTNPSITALSDGGFVVTWQSLGQDGSGYGVHGQRYDAAGANVGVEFQINTHTMLYQSDPSITDLSDGGFVVAWMSDSQDGDGYGIFAQRYDAAGASVGDEFQVNTYTTDHQYYPSITALNDGGFVVAWESESQDGGGFGIYAQHYAAQLFGTAGADVVEDTIGAGWINGQGGGDVLKGFGGKDTIYGGDGGDTLSGGASKDLLFGDGGKDILRGGKGNDELDGGAKNDKLTGGDGKDKFVFMDGSGKDRITDFEDDIDTIRLDEALWGGGMTKQQVINTYASVDGGDIVFDFGTDQLRLKSFTDLTELKDDMAFL